MIISRTPLRVSFLGGGSDIPAYYREHGGAVLSTTIEHSVYLTVSKKFDDAVRVSYSKTEEVKHSREVQHPLVREALDLLGIEGGVEITSVADIPARGTGLGSSSSFTVGLLNALYAYQGMYASSERLAVESCDIEIGRCGEPIGKQDQYAAAFGGFNLIRFAPDDSVDVKPVLLPEGAMNELQARVMMFYTGITRAASGILREQMKQVQADDSKKAAVANMVKLAEAAFREICNGNIADLGDMLHEAWQKKRNLSSGVSNASIDAAYQAAFDAGAAGGKLLGAGGGGFLMLYVPTPNQEAVRGALRGMKEIPFRMTRAGSRIIFVH